MSDPGRPPSICDAREQPAPGREPLPTSVRLGYGVGAVGTGVFATIPGLLLLYYMTDTLGIGAALAGIGIFVPKLWDVFTDPFMGTISDRTVSRFGRRRPYLLAGAITLPVCFALLFSCPFDTPGASFGWVMTTYVLAATAFTVFSVPYTAMPAEMSDDYDEVTSLMGWRVALLTIGVLLSGATAPMLVELGGGGRSGYTLMSVVLAGLIFAAMMACFWGTARAKSRARIEQTPRFSVQVRQALEVKPFVVLVGGYVLQQTGVGVMLASVPYFARYTIGGDDGMVTILFVALVGPAFAFMPAWVWISKRTGKLTAYLISTLMVGGGTASLWLASAAAPRWVYAQVALVGIGWAGTQLFPFSMLPDTMAADRVDSGQRREGVFTGLWMAVDKGGLAMGALAAGLVLDVGGFIETTGDVVAEQPDTALAAIRVCAALLPALMMLLSVPVLRRYDLDRARSQQMYAQVE